MDEAVSEMEHFPTVGATAEMQACGVPDSSQSSQEVPAAQAFPDAPHSSKKDAHYSRAHHGGLRDRDARAAQ